MRLAFTVGLILIAGLLQGCAVAPGAREGARTVPERGVNEAYREDQKIEAKAIDLIYEQFRIFMHVNVTSFNRSVLISGEVPDETTLTAIEKIVSGMEGVRHVYNELVISGNSSLASRSNDSMITSAVKLRLAREKRIYADRIRVMTENATVFLMGDITGGEADAAAEIASTTGRVKRVVKLFEYAD